MGYRQRIEAAVIALFELERAHDKHIEKVFGNASTMILDAVDSGSACDIALDLLCIPQDNTCDFDYNAPELKGEWPDGCFCRDYYLELWMREANNGQEFLDYCYKALKGFSEKGLTFARPKRDDKS
jgi:hypothetical protein